MNQIPTAEELMNSKEFEPDNKLNIMKIVYDKVNARVVSEDDSRNVFYINDLDLSCPEEVIERVVEIFNSVGEGEEYVGSSSDIDDYLLDECRCTQEDREHIVESIYKFLYSDKK